MTKKGKMTKLSIAVFTAILMLICSMSSLLAACGGVSISLDKTELSMYVGDAERLTATISGGADEDIEWSSSNESVASVRRGLVTAIAEGTATITASTESGATATCSVTVGTRTVTISQESASLALDGNKTIQLTAESSDNKDITWSSSDPSIANVVDGLVTAGDMTGTVDIIASCGSAKAICKVTVTAPDDYYKLTIAQNLQVVADPGVWHYFADGSMGQEFGFEEAPVHMNATASVTLNIIPDVEKTKYFYFRYQPDEIEIGEYYTMKLAVKVSEDADIRLASKRADGVTSADTTETLTANTEKEVTYIGYRNTAEPFSVRINTPVNADKVTLAVRLVSVEENDGTNLPEYHTSVVEKPNIKYTEIEKDTSSYELAPKTNSATMSAPSVWGYNIGSGSALAAENGAKYDNGTITLKFDSLDVTGSDKSNQLRYKPTHDGDIKIKVEFSVTSNVEANIALALSNTKDYSTTGWVAKPVSANSTVDFSTEATLTNNHIIIIQINATNALQSNAEFTISDIKMYKGEEAPTEDVSGSYEVESKTNDEVKANPGIWAYNASADDVISGTPSYNDGTLSINFSSFGAGNANDVQLRLRPDLAAGTQYTISFTVTASEALAVACAPSSGSEWYSGNIDAANGSVTLNCTFTAEDTRLIYIRLRNTADDAKPIDVTVSGITITVTE